MNSLNLQFLESYKRLDSLLKDMYQSEKGVNEYIDDMEKIHNGSCFVDDWDSVFKQLEHFRHIRNRLSHEVGSFGEDLCNESDILWLDNFRESLMNQTDPLSLHKKHLKTNKTKSVADFNRCSESDIRWLDNFRESLINQTDPLSLHKKTYGSY